MPFLGTLKYERLEDKDSDFGRPLYRLTEPFGYYSDYHLPCEPIRCEEGFETDFASIPEWIFFLRPKNGKWKKASVIHDKACKLPMSAKTADIIFYYAMLEDEASIFTAYLLYFAVRLNHIVVGKK